MFEQPFIRFWRGKDWTRWKFFGHFNFNSNNCLCSNRARAFTTDWHDFVHALCVSVWCVCCKLSHPLSYPVGKNSVVASSKKKRQANESILHTSLLYAWLFIIETDVCWTLLYSISISRHDLKIQANHECVAQIRLFCIHSFSSANIFSARDSPAEKKCRTLTYLFDAALHRLCALNNCQTVKVHIEWLPLYFSASIWHPIGKWMVECWNIIYSVNGTIFNSDWHFEGKNMYCYSKYIRAVHFSCCCAFNSSIYSFILITHAFDRVFSEFQMLRARGIAEEQYCKRLAISTFSQCRPHNSTFRRPSRTAVQKYKLLGENGAEEYLDIYSDRNWTDNNNIWIFCGMWDVRFMFQLHICFSHEKSGPNIVKKKNGIPSINYPEEKPTNMHKMWNSSEPEKNKNIIYWMVAISSNIMGSKICHSAYFINGNSVYERDAFLWKKNRMKHF